jgi:hypothetical protein
LPAGWEWGAVDTEIGTGIGIEIGIGIGTEIGTGNRTNYAVILYAVILAGFVLP